MDDNTDVKELHPEKKLPTTICFSYSVPEEYTNELIHGN